ncbi:hypothetical protein MTO96_035926 [Rhipicephalus appendiculatus]|uniref:Basic tail secreted protein n=2 Tax=Rhipicephalus TaxID=426455 RepID=A0A131YF22_RHIAP
MKASVVTLLLCAVLFCAQLQESECLFKKQKCGKIIASKFTNFFGRTLYCTYLCRSFPPRMERESDGTPCWNIRGKGACQGGRCRIGAGNRVTTVKPLPPKPKTSG